MATPFFKLLRLKRIIPDGCFSEHIESVKKPYWLCSWKYCQNPTTSDHFHWYHLVWVTVIAHLDYFRHLLTILPALVMLPCGLNPATGVVLKDTNSTVLPLCKVFHLTYDGLQGPRDFVPSCPSDLTSNDSPPPLAHYAPVCLGWIIFPKRCLCPNPWNPWTLPCVAKETLQMGVS